MHFILPQPVRMEFSKVMTTQSKVFDEAKKGFTSAEGCIGVPKPGGSHPSECPDGLLLQRQRVPVLPLGCSELNLTLLHDWLIKEVLLIGGTCFVTEKFLVSRDFAL